LKIGSFNSPGDFDLAGTFFNPTSPFFPVRAADTLALADPKRIDGDTLLRPSGRPILFFKGWYQPPGFLAPNATSALFFFLGVLSSAHLPPFCCLPVGFVCSRFFFHPAELISRGSFNVLCDRPGATLLCLQFDQTPPSRLFVAPSPRPPLKPRTSFPYGESIFPCPTRLFLDLFFADACVNPPQTCIPFSNSPPFLTQVNLFFFFFLKTPLQPRVFPPIMTIIP